MELGEKAWEKNIKEMMDSLFFTNTDNKVKINLTFKATC